MKWIERERQMSHDFVYMRTLMNKTIDNTNNKTGNKPTGTQMFKGILEKKGDGVPKKRQKD